MPVVDFDLGNSTVKKLDFEDVYHMYHAYVFRLALQFLRNHYDAEDAAQETWKTISENMRIFEIHNEAAHRSYIAEVVKGKSIDIQRKRQRQDRLNVDADPYIISQNVAGNEQCSGFYELWANEVWRVLCECIRSMKEPLCDIYYYYYIEEFPVSEIAEKLNMNVKTVYTRMERGRGELARLIEEKGITRFNGFF